MSNENPTVIEIKSAPNNQEKTWATFAHLSALLGIVIPLFSMLGPLIVWLLKRNEMPFVDNQGKEALNFQITMLIAFAVSWLLAFILIGYFLIFIIAIIDLILIIVAAVNANKGNYYRYPLTLRMIK